MFLSKMVRHIDTEMKKYTQTSLETVGKQYHTKAHGKIPGLIRRQNEESWLRSITGLFMGKNQQVRLHTLNKFRIEDFE